jgi:lactoylglutathione lyase
MKEGHKRLVGLAHICIYTNDIDASIHFYRHFLHFQVDYQAKVNTYEGAYWYASISLGNLVLELVEIISPRIELQTMRGAIDHFAIEVENIEAVVEELHALGLETDTDVFTFKHLLKGTKGVFLHGPSGELIELFEFSAKPEPILQPRKDL